ncbi:MAG: hypothetical protein WCT04_22585 [Planctomycetota bacterium]
MKRFTIAAIAFLAFAGFSSIRAEETQLSPEEEAKIAAKEDAAGDEAMIKGQKCVFTGVIVLDDPDKPSDRGVIGSLVCDDSKTYPMKAGSDEILVELKKNYGKKATVAGKLRVNGKYLIVMAIVESTPSPTPRDKRKRSGL